MLFLFCLILFISQIYGQGGSNDNNNNQMGFPSSSFSGNMNQNSMGNMNNMQRPWMNQNGQGLMRPPPNGWNMPMRPMGHRIDMLANRAVVVLNGTVGVRGTIVFTAEDMNGLGRVRITGNVTGLQPNTQHGFHIHQYGDLSNGCTSAGSHFNPWNQTHGAPNDTQRHVGDLGNVLADRNGMVTLNQTDSQISFGGPACIIGRAVVIHQLQDDLGKGGNADSLATGNAGGRVVCGVIGIAAS